MKSKTILSLCLSASFMLGVAAAEAGPSDDLAKMLGMKGGHLVMGDYASPDGAVSYQGAGWNSGGLDITNLSLRRGDLQIQADHLQATNGLLDFHGVTLINTKGNLSTLEVGRLRSMGSQAYEILDVLDENICPMQAAEAKSGVETSAPSEISMEKVRLHAPKDPITNHLKLPGTSGPETINIASIEGSLRHLENGGLTCLDIPSAELTGISLQDATGNRLDIASSSFSSQSRPMQGQDVSAAFSFGGLRAVTAQGQNIWKLDSMRIAAHAGPDTVKAFRAAKALIGIKKALLSPEVIMSGGGGVSFSLSGLDIPNPAAAPNKPEISPRISGNASFSLKVAGPAISVVSKTDMTGVAKSSVDMSFMLSDDTKAKAASAAIERLRPGAGTLGLMSIIGAKVSYIDQGMTAIIEDRTGQKASDLADKVRSKIAAKAPPEVAGAVAGWVKTALSDPLGARLSIKPDAPAAVSDIAMTMIMNPISLVNSLNISTK